SSEAGAEDLVMRPELKVEATFYDNPSFGNIRNIRYHNNTRPIKFSGRLVRVKIMACIFCIHRDFLDKSQRVFWSHGLFFCGMRQVLWNEASRRHRGNWIAE